jgi:hypothetical protein
LAAACQVFCPYRGSHHTDPILSHSRFDNSFIRDGEIGAGTGVLKDVGIEL